jgi:hypothetical protein
MKVPGGMCFLGKHKESRLATAAGTGRGPKKGLAEKVQSGRDLRVIQERYGVEKSRYRCGEGRPDFPGLRI